MKERFSISEVAMSTGIPVHKISYAIDNLRVEGPSERFGTMRVFTTQDIQRIKTFFSETKQSKKGPKKP